MMKHKKLQFHESQNEDDLNDGWIHQNKKDEPPKQKATRSKSES